MAINRQIADQYQTCLREIQRNRLYVDFCIRAKPNDLCSGKIHPEERAARLNCLIGRGRSEVRSRSGIASRPGEIKSISEVNLCEGVFPSTAHHQRSKVSASTVSQALLTQDYLFIFAVISQSMRTLIVHGIETGLNFPRNSPL
jgi:hypothetical protein